jgi:hypothetical protein
LLVNSADRGSSAWYIRDPGTHDPTMDAPCEAPAACRDSRLDNAHVAPTLHRIYLHVQETWKGRFARARARTAVAWFETKFRIEFRIIFRNICITFTLCSRGHASSILESIAASWLPDAPLVFAKASECTKLLDLLPAYACDAAIIRPESGFLKAILQNDFVLFKYRLGTPIISSAAYNVLLTCITGV